MITAIIIAISIRGIAFTKSFHLLSEERILEIIYRSKLKIIPAQRRARTVLTRRLSKMMESAKKEDTKARMVVKTMVIPMLEYLVISKRGQFFNNSRLAPEHFIKNRFMIFTLIEGFIF
tara:strand:+ start:532 stop:888 length:357 start_codon:yes stop_codon:yes gene_type:complete